MEKTLQKLWKTKSIPAGCKCELSFTVKWLNSESQPDKKQVELAVYSLLQTLYGLDGVCHEFNLESYDIENGTGMYLVSPQGFNKLWTAMTLKGTISGVNCAIAVNNVKLVQDTTLQMNLS